ncbi:MAG: hypothetical protein ABW034_19670, partial [Steroidobacteraceae bacterium]
MGKLAEKTILITVAAGERNRVQALAKKRSLRHEVELRIIPRTYRQIARRHHVSTNLRFFP